MIISFEGFIITIVIHFWPLARIITISGLNTLLTLMWASKSGSVGTCLWGKSWPNDGYWHYVGLLSH